MYELMLKQFTVCELMYFLRWWKDLDFSSNLPFVRDRVVEGYFWIAIACFEPQYSYARRIQTKLHALMTTTDDIFDAYGTLEELGLYTEAIGRFDICKIKITDELISYLNFKRELGT